jgi:hypothetical protein
MPDEWSTEDYDDQDTTDVHVFPSPSGLRETFQSV